jgi:hypothetical protein
VKQDQAGQRLPYVPKRTSTKIRIFHPDYPSSYTLGGAIIECQGGISFRFPLALLSASAPFATASELSLSPSIGVQDEEIIVLDNVSPRGFHLCLTALHPTTSYFTSKDKTLRLNSKTIEEIIEAFDTADFLDIPNLAQLLIPYFDNPFFKFALSTGSNDPRLIQQTAEKTLNHSFDQMQGRAEQLLGALNPSYHPRLRQLHETRNKVPKHLVLALMGSRTCDQSTGFAPTCEKIQCPASVSAKSWEKLKGRAVNQVYEALRQTPAPPSRRAGIAEKVLQGSCKGCARCKQRLLDSFVKEFKKLEADLPTEV